MKRYIAVFAAIICSWSFGDRRTMTCQVFGCSTDTVSLAVDQNRYIFEFSEDRLSDYPLNYDISVAFADAKLIGENDRIDHVTLMMNSKNCVEGRNDIGDVACKGRVEWAAVRVRRDENHNPNPNTENSRFTYETIFSPLTNPWNFEVRALPDFSGQGTEWFMVFTIDGKEHKLYPFLVNQCRYSI